MKEERLIVQIPEKSGVFNAMFTGIITHLGPILAKSETKLTVKAGTDLMVRLNEGTSIAVDGICLTVVKITKQSFEVDFMPETMARTNIRYLKPHNLVNLELPATQDSFLSGHIIYGHIDGIAKLKSITKNSNSHILQFLSANTLSKYIVQKGSIAVNGISLSVIEAKKVYFTVGIIPYTWDRTMLHTLKIGDLVNIEVDILAKYLERLFQK